MTASQSNDQFTITVEMAEGFEPSARLAAAIEELVAAIGDEADEVAGFDWGVGRGITGPMSFSWKHSGDTWYSEPTKLEKVKTVRT
jgi:hypothetical protein